MKWGQKCPRNTFLVSFWRLENSQNGVLQICPPGVIRSNYYATDKKRILMYRMLNANFNNGLERYMLLPPDLFILKVSDSNMTGKINLTLKINKYRVIYTLLKTWNAILLTFFWLYLLKMILMSKSTFFV
jgi:hypothetical protein